MKDSETNIEFSSSVSEEQHGVKGMGMDKVDNYIF